MAIFGTIFTSRLADNLTAALESNPQLAVQAGITSPDSLVPAAVQAAQEPLRSAIVDGYASALAPVFWYVLPLLLVGVVLALILREVPLSKVAGMVARGEAVAAHDATDPDQRLSSSRTPAAATR